MNINNNMGHYNTANTIQNFLDASPNDRTEQGLLAAIEGINQEAPSVNINSYVEKVEAVLSPVFVVGVLSGIVATLDNLFTAFISSAIVRSSTVQAVNFVSKNLFRSTISHEDSVLTWLTTLANSSRSEVNNIFIVSKYALQASVLGFAAIGVIVILGNTYNTNQENSDPKEITPLRATIKGMVIREGHQNIITVKNANGIPLRYHLTENGRQMVIIPVANLS